MWSSVKQGSINSVVVPITPSETAPPRVVVGLNSVDMAHNANIRVHAYVDSVDSNKFCTHIDTWHDSTLYNGGLSWLKLSSADPDFQCGTFSCGGTASEWVSFNWLFDSPPTVFVGLSKFDIGNDWHASVYATDVSRTGFQIHAEKWGNTIFHGCAITWVAVSADKEGVLCGTFGGNHTTESGYSGTISFDPTFNHIPSVLTAIQKFSIDKNKNLRASVSTQASTTDMHWNINTWSDSRLHEVQVAYLALDCCY
jgi:H-type lectin domain